ncbi:MAG: hypothetical protein JW768_11030 [Chitinispirillaceae bacterium]|nr:hypothetical protein [Chitinispirillaceae bacterium]
MELQRNDRFVTAHFIVSIIPFFIIAVISSVRELELNFFTALADYLADGVVMLFVLLFVALNATVFYLMQLSIDPQIRKWRLPLFSILLQASSVVLLCCYVFDLSVVFN